MPSVPLGALAVVAALVACGCSTGEADTPPRAVTRPEAVEGCPLTGEPYPGGMDADRPAVAVKVGNGGEARPQSGLAEADLVYEEPVEGGLAWFVAVYHCGNPELVGPVRHAHPADAGILAGHDPVLFAHAGASSAVADELDRVETLAQADGRLEGTGFRRVPERPVPNNLFVSVPELRSLGGVRPGAPAPWAPFAVPGEAAGDAASPSPSARPADGVTFTQGGTQVRYTWDPKARGYVRTQGGEPFTDPSGRPVLIRNLVFLWVPVVESEARDAAGNPTPVLTLTGSGDALLLTGGTEQSGTWERRSLDDPPVVVDRDGAPMPLRPGNSWIHLLPADSPVFVR